MIILLFRISSDKFAQVSIQVYIYIYIVQLHPSFNRALLQVPPASSVMRQTFGSLKSIPICSMVLVHLPTKLADFCANVGTVNIPGAYGIELCADVLFLWGGPIINGSCWAQCWSILEAYITQQRCCFSSICSKHYPPMPPISVHFCLSSLPFLADFCNLDMYLICMYMHTYIHTYVRTYIHTSIHPYIHPSIHPYIHS